MRLKKLTVTNFRSYKEKTTIGIDNLTVFIGKNDAGKSSLLDALDIFFNRVPDTDDGCVFCNEEELNNVRIACAFDQLPQDIVIDAQYKTDLKSEYFLNSDGLFEIEKVYNCNVSGKVKSPSVYAHCAHPTASDYSDLLVLTNSKLKERARKLGVDLSGINQTINSELRKAIWQNASDLMLKESEVELKTETAGKIWEQIEKQLPVYAVFKSDRPSTDQDSEAQDPMKSAIKEAIKTQEKSLEDISTIVTRQVQLIADKTVEKIREMDPELAKQLTPRVTTKNWDSLFNVSLTADNQIPINKRGSGTRRLVLLNFFRAKAEQAATEKSAGIIFGVEEPETSQHPSNQKMLIEAFRDLSESENCTVILTTHNPLLARRMPQTALRYVKQKENKSIVSQIKSEADLEEIVKSLGVLPDHEVKAFLGVEGRHDINFLKSISKILAENGEDIENLEKAEATGKLIFLLMGGSSLDLWINRMKGFSRRCFYLMDRDTKPPAKPKYADQADEFNKQPNAIAWTTTKKELENYLHPDAIKKILPSYSGTGDPFEDVPRLFAKAVYESSNSPKTWTEVESNKEDLKNKESSAKKRLSIEVVQSMSPSLLSKIDQDNDIRKWLGEISRELRR